MKGRELANMGLVGGQIKVAMEVCEAASKAGQNKAQLRDAIRAVIADPAAFVDDPHMAKLAEALGGAGFTERAEGAPWQQWGEDLDPQSLRQMSNACRLPVAVRGALMPDAHVGYGLPIGGVLATHNAIIPYAVGVDIACRMRLSVFELPVSALDEPVERARLIKALQEETRFGIGASFRHPRDHEVLDQDWNITQVTREVRQKAHTQLGSSGSGNHFVEYGTFTLTQPELGLAPGTYLALMSHSGSRGPGASVAAHYSRLARSLHPELPQELQHLAWLDMDSEHGQSYWAAMNLMGDFAAANHEVIHREITRALDTTALVSVENHHNFCWLEEHDGQQVYVHRKGATPAGQGVLGVIPGSMASPAYVVRGRGDEASLRSASHGAGRVMSRTQANKTLDWADATALLRARGVQLLSAGLDEVPAVYKDIQQVMDAQTDLVDIVGRFFPKIVKMAPQGERAED